MELEILPEIDTGKVSSQVKAQKNLDKEHKHQEKINTLSNYIYGDRLNIQQHQFWGKLWLEVPQAVELKHIFYPFYNQFTFLMAYYTSSGKDEF